MKRCLPLLLLLLCYACSNQSTKEIPYTIIKGQILKNPPTENRKRIEGIDWTAIEKKQKQIGLITDAIRAGLNTPNHSGVLDKDGNFHFIVALKGPTEVRLRYNRQNIPIYVEPGNEVNIVLDLTKKENPVTISGDNAHISQKFVEFDQLFRDSFNTELNATLSFAIPSEFKTQRAKITQRIRQTTQTFLKELSDNEIIANWYKTMQNIE